MGFTISNVSDETYINNLYKNVLGREADAEGLNYWVTNLSNGIETRYEALLGFAESAENKALFSDMTGFAEPLRYLPQIFSLSFFIEPPYPKEELSHNNCSQGYNHCFIGVLVN